MGFKEMVNADISAVFLNSAEFAELHDVYYGGEEYLQIPVVLTRSKQTGYIPQDHIQGIHSVTTIAHISAADMGNRVPEQGTEIEISHSERSHYYRRYRVLKSSLAMGMITLELEDYDE